MTTPAPELLPVTKLNARMTTSNARAQMLQQKYSLCLVEDSRGQQLGLISIKQLDEAEPDDLLKMVMENAPEMIVTEWPYVLDEVVQQFAKDLELKPNLPGIVIKEGAVVKGVLPREVVLIHTAQVITRSTHTPRLEGAPIDVLFFKCKIDNERKFVPYYDPANPPKCTLRHEMIPDED